MADACTKTKCSTGCAGMQNPDSTATDKVATKCCLRSIRRIILLVRCLTKIKHCMYTRISMADLLINTLIEDVDLGRIALPEIQREFVWSKQKARDLVDSLYKGFPVGVILLWRPQDVQYFRSLEGQETKKNPEWLILDGQQRITSLTKIKRGDIKIIFNIDDEDFHIENRITTSDPRWIRVDQVWKRGTATILQNLSERLDIPMDVVFKKYMGRVQRIYEIPSQKIPVSEVREDDYSRIAEMYIRLNGKGTKLRKAEINLASIVFKFPNIFYERLMRMVDEFEDWELDTNFFLRCFVCVLTDQSKYEPLKRYLDTADEEKVLETLDMIKENLRISLEFITSHFGINHYTNQHLIPSDIAIIPLMMYMIKSNGRIASSGGIDKTVLWFYCASHYGRFSTSTESKLNEDLRELGSSNPVVTWLENIRKERGDLMMREIRGSINRTNLFALYYALVQNGALDWWQGTRVEDTSKIEFHHIFPKKVLRNAGYPNMLINDIRNIAVVSQKANRKINAMRPEMYFENEIEDKSRIFSQFVPQDKAYWRVENYERFLEVREKSIITFLNDRIVNLEK